MTTFNILNFKFSFLQFFSKIIVFNLLMVKYLLMAPQKHSNSFFHSNFALKLRNNLEFQKAVFDGLKLNLIN